MLNIRKAGLDDATEIAKVKVDTWKSAYKGIIPDDYLDSLDYEDQAKKFSGLISKENDTFVLVAEEDSHIVAFAAGGKECTHEYHYEGEVHAIYVRQEYQKQGIGHKLMAQSVKNLKEMGIDSMMVWALEGSPYIKFYESLDGKLIERMPYDLIDSDLYLVSYGWKNINKDFEF